MFVLELRGVWVWEFTQLCQSSQPKSYTRSEHHSVSFGTEHTQLYYLHTLSFKHTPTQTPRLSLTCKIPGFETDTKLFFPPFCLCQSALRLRLFLWERRQRIYGSGLYPLRFLRVSTLVSLRADRVDTQPLRDFMTEQKDRVSALNPESDPRVVEK